MIEGSHESVDNGLTLLRRRHAQWLGVTQSEVVHGHGVRVAAERTFVEGLLGTRAHREAELARPSRQRLHAAKTGIRAACQL